MVSEDKRAEKKKWAEQERVARVAAAEAKRRSLNDAAVAKLEAQCADRRVTGQEKLVCPHCQARGQVTTKKVRVKRGLSGGKSTAAVLTGGWSLLATGLSRSEQVTEARCGNCRTVWTF